MPLDQAVDLFLDHTRIERGLARNSVLAYGRDLAAFRRFCETVALDDATLVEPGHVVDFLVTLAGRKLSVRTQARTLAALRGMFKYLRSERHLAADPTAEIDPPHAVRKLPRRLPGR